MKRTSFLLMSLGTAVFPGLLFAHPGGAGQDGFLPPRMVAALDLTLEQEQAIEEIVTAAKPRFQALRDNARTTRQQLIAANPDDATYSTDVAAASQASASHAAELVNLAAEVKAQVYGVLTAEQKQRATELMAKLQERRGQFMERGRRHPRRWGRRFSGANDCDSGDVNAG